MCYPFQIFHSVIVFVAVDVIHISVMIWIIDPRLGDQSMNVLRRSGGVNHLVASVVMHHL